MRNGQPLPRSKSGLYNAKLAPIAREPGYHEFLQVLCERAWGMHIKQQLVFPKEDLSLPRGFLDVVRSHALLVTRNAKYHFRHQLVRAFLAAKHVRLNYQVLLKQHGDQLTKDSWLGMLEFVALELQSHERHAFLSFLRAHSTDAEQIITRRLS
jgi:hypothetical protein